jgi:omega-amidase
VTLSKPSNTAGMAGTAPNSASAPSRSHTALLTAHLVQVQCAWEEKQANFEQVRTLVDRADVKPGDLILLPEMFDTGFSFNVESTNDKDGQTLSFLLELAEDTGALVQGGRTIAPCHRCAARNVMSVVRKERGQEGSLLAEYAKMKLFSPGGEPERFEAGREVVTYDWNGATFMPAICYDLRFPELFRQGLRLGAEVIALGACWPSVRAHHWRALLIARAIENQCVVLGVNRCGDDPPKKALSGSQPGLHYAGGTIAVSATGEVLGELGETAGVLSVPIDVHSVRAWRERFPAWRDL